MDTGGVYRTEKFTVYFRPRCLVICTAHQAFKISYIKPSNKKLLDELAFDILMGNIKTIQDLRDYGGQLIWTHTGQSFTHQSQPMDSLF